MGTDRMWKGEIPPSVFHDAAGATGVHEAIAFCVGREVSNDVIFAELAKGPTGIASLAELSAWQIQRRYAVLHRHKLRAGQHQTAEYLCVIQPISKDRVWIRDTWLRDHDTWQQVSIAFACMLFRAPTVAAVAQFVNLADTYDQIVNNF